MRTFLLLMTILVLPACKGIALPEPDFMRMQQPVPMHAKLEHKDWFTWGASVLKGDDEKYHMIYCRWPNRGLIHRK